MEEGQPMLLALIAPAAAHRLVERIIAGVAPEESDIARSEECGRRIAERDLANGHQRELRHGLHRALRLRVEGLDAFERVTEEIQPDGVDSARRKEIDDPAALGKFTRLHDG